MRDAYPSILDAIGQTPLVRLDRLTRYEGCEGTILAKLDNLWMKKNYNC